MFNFNKEGMKELHILSEGINFPVAIPIYTDWERTQIRYLLENVRTAGFGSYDICRWCIAHKVFADKTVEAMVRELLWKQKTGPYCSAMECSRDRILGRLRVEMESRGIISGCF